ncbi:hypothetical protein [Sagittula sp. SSi028]|uniref:hypothetical protein n=1 Tax=Sagittula sp. SSi028 TaxID=3400636 RepID=UPI003AF97EE7
MSETDTRLREALDHMFETATTNGKDSLEVTAQELANAAEVEGKTGSVSVEAARRVMADVAAAKDSISDGTARYVLPR